MDVWASRNTDHIEWGKARLGQGTIVACEGKKIVGFGKMTPTGLLDMLYVHKDYIKKGVGTLICDELEKQCETSEITVYASITAKPFFEKRGYKVIKENEVEREGVALINFLMTKHL